MNVNWRSALCLAAWIVCCGVARPHGGAHDFDFEFGSWSAHLSRLEHPLSGSHTWVTYDGISVVHPMLAGRENIGELEVAGADGRIDGLTIRLYDRRAQQWHIYWGNADDPVIDDTPQVGGFSNGRGVFYGDDTLRGKPILVRFVFSDIRPASFHFEQAFSADGGKTWETNWVATFKRMRNAALIRGSTRAFVLGIA